MTVTCDKDSPFHHAELWDEKCPRCSEWVFRRRLGETDSELRARVQARLEEQDQMVELRRRLAVALEKVLQGDYLIPYTEQGIALLEAAMRQEVHRFELEHGLPMLDTGISVAEYNLGGLAELQLSLTDAPPPGTPEWFTLHCERFRFAWEMPGREVGSRVIYFRSIPDGRIEWRPPRQIRVTGTVS